MQALNPIILKGEEIISISFESDEIHLKTRSGKHYRFYHDQDCCESVSVHDISGNISLFSGGYTVEDVVETIVKDENPKDITPPEYQDSFTWTTHTFVLRSIEYPNSKAEKVSIRWYGDSNGYYSESVTLEEVKEARKDAGFSISSIPLGDINKDSLVVISTPPNYRPSPEEILNLEGRIKDRVKEFNGFVLLAPNTISINNYPESEMNKIGWYRKENN